MLHLSYDLLFLKRVWPWKGNIKSRIAAAGLSITIKLIAGKQIRVQQI